MSIGGWTSLGPSVYTDHDPYTILANAIKVRSIGEGGGGGGGGGNCGTGSGGFQKGNTCGGGGGGGEEGGGGGRRGGRGRTPERGGAPTYRDDEYRDPSMAGMQPGYQRPRRGGVGSVGPGGGDLRGSWKPQAHEVAAVKGWWGRILDDLESHKNPYVNVTTSAARIASRTALEFTKAAYHRYGNVNSMLAFGAGVGIFALTAGAGGLGAAAGAAVPHGALLAQAAFGLAAAELHHGAKSILAIGATPRGPEREQIKKSSYLRALYKGVTGNTEGGEEALSSADQIPDGLVQMVIDFSKKFARQLGIKPPNASPERVRQLMARMLTPPTKG